MSFKKGYIPWNKGKKQSYPAWNAGKTIADDSRIAKLRTKTSGGSQLKDVQFKKGNRPWNKEIKIDRGKYPNMGHNKSHSEESKKIIAINRREKAMGKDNGWWNGGGIGTERHKAMGRWEYREWRRAVFERDNYTCQECGDKGVFLNADHIKPWALYPKLRYKIANGRTLCVPCHMKTPTWGVRALKFSENISYKNILRGKEVRYKNGSNFFCESRSLLK